MLSLSVGMHDLHHRLYELVGISATWELCRWDCPVRYNLTPKVVTINLMTNCYYNSE